MLISESFEFGLFSNKPEIARVISGVIPVFEKSLSTITSNYRSMSLLSIFSKVMQKLMHKLLYGFLEVHGILFSSQFGFCNGHSADHALGHHTENIKFSFIKNRLGCGIFIDLQKAFDTESQYPLKHCFPKWAVPPPWGRCFDIGGRLSLFLNTYFLNNIVVFTLKKNLTCVYGGKGR